MVVLINEAINADKRGLKEVVQAIGNQREQAERELVSTAQAVDKLEARRAQKPRWLKPWIPDESAPRLVCRPKP